VKGSLHETFPVDAFATPPTLLDYNLREDNICNIVGCDPNSLSIGYFSKQLQSILGDMVCQVQIATPKGLARHPDYTIKLSKR
jgi:hypothetical protein